MDAALMSLRGRHLAAACSPAETASTAPPPPLRTSQPAAPRLVARAVVGARAGYLFLPIFIVILFSFNDNKGRFNFTWHGFTLRHWQHPFQDPDLATAFKNSLAIAGIATAIAVFLGTLMAIALVRYGFRSRSADRLLRVPAARRPPRSCSAPRCSACS